MGYVSYHGKNIYIKYSFDIVVKPSKLCALTRETVSGAAGAKLFSELDPRVNQDAGAYYTKSS